MLTAYCRRSLLRATFELAPRAQGAGLGGTRPVLIASLPTPAHSCSAAPRYS